MEQQDIVNRESKNGAAKADTAARREPAVQEARVSTPLVDVLENGDEVLVLADLPGVKADDLTLHLEKDTLTLTAERKAGASERPVVYKRAFFVPNDLDADAIEAKLEDGVLTLRLPRRQSAKPRTIRVKTG